MLFFSADTIHSEVHSIQYSPIPLNSSHSLAAPHNTNHHCHHHRHHHDDDVDDDDYEPPPSTHHRFITFIQNIHFLDTNAWTHTVQYSTLSTLYLSPNTQYVWTTQFYSTKLCMTQRWMAGWMADWLVGWFAGWWMVKINGKLFELGCWLGGWYDGENILYRTAYIKNSYIFVNV